MLVTGIRSTSWYLSACLQRVLLSGSLRNTSLHSKIIWIDAWSEMLNEVPNNSSHLYQKITIFCNVYALFSSLQTSSCCWWVKKRFLLSSRRGAPVWTSRNHQSCHTLKRNRRNCGPVRTESSFKSLWSLKKMMKRTNSFIKEKLKRTALQKQKLMERTVEDQNQPVTLIQILMTQQHSPLNLSLMTVVIGGKLGNIHPVWIFHKTIT